jgi:hypothetical protein
MKNSRIILLIVMVILSINLTACSNGGYDKCVQGMVDDGYSVEEAQELCHDAEMESQIR